MYKLWKLDGKNIEIPFAPQSRLSGFEGTVGDTLVYETTFSIPEDWKNDRVILHFGAVDQVCEVYVNSILAGKHEG